MIELLPQDRVVLSTDDRRLLEAVYAHFDKAGSPADPDVIAYEFKDVQKRVRVRLFSQALAPYLFNGPDGKLAPTLRCAIKLWRATDLELCWELYDACRDLYRPGLGLGVSKLPARLQSNIPRLAWLVVNDAFVRFDQRSVPATMQISPDVLDGKNLAEYLADRHGLERTSTASSAIVAPVFIDGFSIEEFRSFGRASLVDIGALTVFAGPNEAGKTNIMRALRFVSRSAAVGVAAAMKAENGAGEFVRKTEGTRSSCLSVVLRNAAARQSFEYSIRVSRDHDHIESFNRYSMRSAREIFEQPSEPQQVLALQQNGISLAVTDAKDRDSPTIAKEQSLVSTLADLKRFKTAIEVREAMRSWSFFAFEPSDLRSDAAEHGSLLQPDGKNLAAAINALGTRHPKQFVELADTFVGLLPEAVGLSSELGLNGNPRLLLRERGLTDPLTQTDYSDGMLRILAILYLVFSPDRPSLVCIEEPENGLYPRLIEALLEVLRILSKKTQVFLSTHSTTLLNRLSPSEVVFVHRDSDGSHLQRLDTRNDVVNFASRLGIGTQLLSGNLEDVS